jgi:hypothetical protein
MIVCHARRKERLADFQGSQTHGGALADSQSFNAIRGHVDVSLLDLLLRTRRMLGPLQTTSFSCASSSSLLLASPRWPRVPSSCYLLPSHRADWLDGLLLARVVACCTPPHCLRGVDLRFMTALDGAITIQHLLAVRTLCLHPNPTLLPCPMCSLGHDGRALTASLILPFRP